MNADKVLDALEIAVRETMETMFFSDVAVAAASDFDSEAFCAEVRFDGCTHGCFRLAVEKRAAEDLASCLTGPEEDQAPDPAAAVGEIANIICGSTLSHLYADGHISLSSPCLRDGAVPDESAIRSVFQVDAGLLAAELTWRS